MSKMKASNPELHGLININTTYETIFLFILIIGIYEALTKPSWLKNSIRILLICIIVGISFSDLIPVNNLYSAVYNTVWFFATAAFILILIKILYYFEHKSQNYKIRF
jgi:hypothetical protein